MAEIPSAECIRQLREFEATLTHARDLFTSTRSLLSYSFGGQRIADIFRSALSYPDHLEKCKEFSRRLCEIVLSPLENLLVAERCTVEKCEISEQMQLFWEVYQLKFIPNLLDSSTLSALDKMTESVEAYIKEIDKNSLSQLRLPSELLCLFNVEEWDASSNFPAKEPCFFKDVSIQHGRQSETIQNESRAGKDFVLRLNEVLDGVGAGNFDVESMKKLSDFRLETCLPFDDAMQIAYRFTSVLGKLSTWQCDITEAFLTMFENFFQSLSEESKFSVVRLVYERHLPKDDSCLIFLENYIRSYSTDVTKCVNGIGDHNEIQSHPEKFNDIRKKLSWYLFTVPGPTLRRLLSQCLQNKSIVPGVLNILRSCRVLFEFTVKSHKVVGVEYLPILIESIMILFDDEIHRLQSTERQDQFVYLLTSLCRDKRGTAKDKPVTAAEKAILKASVLVRLFVLPNLMQRTHETLMLRLLQRLFQSSGARGVHFEWTVAIGQKRANTVQTPELLLLVVQSFMEYESKDRQGAELCHSILKNLSKRLRSDDVIFNKETADFVLLSLRRYPWWIRYAICSWFAHTLSTPKQQIPAGLYKSLPLDQQEQCEQITVDFPFSHAECFFRSLFELALFECDLALEFLRKGIVVFPRDGNLVEKIALALVDSCEQTSYKQNMTSLAPLLSELLRVLDPSQELHFMELLCESTYCGLKLIQHILLIATAVKLAYHKENNSGPTDSPHSHSSHGSESRTNYHVADILLQAFCELAKAHTDKEVISLRQSKLQQPSDIKDDLLPPPHLKVRLDERVYAQIAVLFNVTCSLTRLVPETPASLKVLINCLAEYLFELQNLRAPKFLDDLSSDHYKSNTVYAYANADVKKQENYNEEDCKESEEHSRQKSTSSANESYCVQNELFDKLGTTILKMDTIATARQITGSNIRRLAENRLISGESSVDVPSHSCEMAFLMLEIEQVKTVRKDGSRSVDRVSGNVSKQDHSKNV